MSRKVFVFNDHFGVGRCFQENGWENVSTIEEADLGVLTGGEDISPALYGEEEHPRTYAGPSRDRIEVDFYKKCVELRKPMAGICRGAQLINAMQGGKLFQHVNNHGGRHEIIDFISKELVETNSVHHQMMRPAKHGLIVAGLFNHATTRQYMKDGESVDDGSGLDPEVILYHDHAGKPSFLCFQAHPEFDHGGPTTKYFFHLLERELNL